MKRHRSGLSFAAAAVGVLAVLAGCGGPAPAPPAVTVRLGEVAVGPSPLAAGTPLRLTFTVTCSFAAPRKVPIEHIVAEAWRPGGPVATTRVPCKAARGRPYAHAPWVGDGLIELGELPAGRHVITLTLQPPWPGWTVPAPQTITVEVPG